MNPTDILDLFDRLDVPGLAILTGFGFWKVLQLMNKISNNLSLVEQKLSHIDENMDGHIVLNHEEHQRMDRSIEKLKDRSYENAASVNGQASNQ